MGLINTYGGVSELPSYSPPYNKIDPASVTAATAGITYFVYCGTANRRYDGTYNLLSAKVRVTTAYVAGGGSPWAEVGLYKSTSFNHGGNTVLSRISYLDVSATFNSTGVTNSSFSANWSGTIYPGEHLWFAWASNATTTQFQLRAGFIDDLGIGSVGSSAATRPSTSSAPTSTSGVAVVPAFVSIYRTLSV